MDSGGWTHNDKSSGELALDALVKVGAITDDQHAEAVARLREDRAAQATSSRTG